MQVAVLKHMLEDRSVGRAKVLEFGGGVVMNLQLKAGEKVARHRTPSDAIVHVVAGRVRFGVGEKDVELVPGMLLHMDPQEEHELEAIEDASILVMKIGSNTTCGS